MPEPAQIRTARRDLQRLMTERGRLLERAHHAERLDRDAVRGVDDRIRDVLEELRRRRGAVDAGPEAPLVLLPVRIETRFGTRDGRPVLRVRVYPDDVHVDGLERGLTESEYAAGQGWWQAAWADGEAAEQARTDAFAVLVRTVGPDRAEWVARATTPLNLHQRPAAAPAFPDRLPPLGRGAVARALPDQFVAVAVQGAQTSRGVGRPIPPDLAVSPVPTADVLAPPDPADASTLRVAAGSEWLVDYERALEVGMALEVPLQGGAARVDRLVVMGTRSAATGTAGAAELEDLLVAHRFGAGLGLLPQGTPTNNADADRSPYRPRREPVAPPVTPPVATEGSDASTLAETLGVDPALVTDLVGGGTGEQALAGHVNTALWGAGWGSYLKLLDDRDVPGVSASSRDRARRLFGAHVRGRGPAPALRVGPQPYGVLPVSDPRAWQPNPGEAGSGVAAVVASLLDQWLWSARTVPLVRPGSGDVPDLLLEVMGSSPVLQYLRVRPELDEDAALTAGAATGTQPRLYEWEKWLTAAVAAPLLGVDAGKLSLGSLDHEDRPLPLPLVSERDDEFVTALLRSPSRVLEVDSVLQALLYLSWRHAEDEVEKASPLHVIPDLLAAGQLERRLADEVTSVVRRAESVEPTVLFALADRVAGAGERDAAASRLSSFQPVAAVSTSLADVALSAIEGQEAQAMATVVVGEWLQRAAYRSELRAALGGLLGSDLEARRLAVAEALDLHSHRLDAWATAVVAERRARQAAGGQARGLTIGAYGVVEELDPGSGGGPHGWMHAPSPEHAVAAGMLRSAHLGHRGDGEDPFALDLSSARVRAADHVLEGVRAGQQPAALIGYQLERDLVSSGLGRFQLSLRTVAPLVARRLSDRPGTPGSDSAAAQESVAATDVVDGLLLLTQFPPADATAMQRLRQRLDVPPENAHLPPEGWASVTDAEAKSLQAVLSRAADTVDAVADVLLAESVLQYAAGNAGRAAAAMDVLGPGGPVADTLDVLEAHDSGRRLTHAALIVVGPDVPTSWDASRPRALAEPRLEAWASAQLGRPHDVVLATVGTREVTLEEAGLCALDLVFTDGPAALAAAVRAAVPDLAGAALTVDVEGTASAPTPAGRAGLREVLAQAVSLRALVAGAEPVTPVHLERPHERLPDEAPGRDLGAALDELCARVEDLADGLAAVVADLTVELAGIPQDGVVADQTAAEAAVAAAHALDAYGIPLAGPRTDRPLDVGWVRSALQAAEARSTNAQASVARMRERRAGGAAPSDVLEAAQDVATGVLGDGFVVLPLLPGGGGSDPFVEAVRSPAFPAPPASAVRRFVQDHATVRAGLRRWSEARLLGDALGHGQPWTVAQLSETGTTGPAPGTDRWLAGPLPPAGPWPDGPVTHLVLEVHGTLAADEPLAGLVVDGWVEDLPDQPGTQADPQDPQPGRARTGLAVHVDAASARPPQAVLCAVSPDGSRWTEDSVRAVVEATLSLARARMVTLERLSGQARVLPALYVRHDALQGSRFLRWATLAEVSSTFSAATFVKDA